MDKEEIKKEEVIPEIIAAVEETEIAAPIKSAGKTAFVPDAKRFKPFGRPRPGFERVKPEFEQKIVSIRRVTRVVSGGRRFTFSVALLAGDKKGSVGFGMGKAMDTALAIQKAYKAAKKNMFKIKTTKTMSIPHDVTAKFCSSKIMIMPNRGKGIIAGSSVRDIVNIAGLKDISSKILSGSKNKINNAKATLKALESLKEIKG